MKANYKNWIPKGMILAIGIGTIISFVLLIVFATTGIVRNTIIRQILIAVLILLFSLCAIFTVWSVHAYNSFSYTGKRKLSKQIVEGIAEYVVISRHEEYVGRLVPEKITDITEDFRKILMKNNIYYEMEQDNFVIYGYK